MKFRFVTSVLIASSISSVAVARSQLDPSEVLATHGSSISVTYADFQGALHTLPANVRERASADPKVVTQVLDTIMLNRVLAQQAREQGLADSPEVKAELAQVAERALSVRRMEAFEASLTVPDFTKAAKERYEVNRDRFAEPEQVAVAHILITKNDRSPEAAESLAAEVRGKVLEGQDFEKLAMQYSEDPGSKPRGGNLGFIARGKTVKEFEQAAFSLQNTGDVSPVVKSQFGYHIIKLLEHKAARQKTFEEVKDGIIAPMRARYINEEKMRMTSKLRNDPSITLNKTAIDSLITTGKSEEDAAAAAH